MPNRHQHPLHYLTMEERRALGAERMHRALRRRRNSERAFVGFFVTMVLVGIAWTVFLAWAIYTVVEAVAK